MNKHNRIQALKGLIAKKVCDYMNCSDGDDIQYPKCKIINTDKTYFDCACVKFGVAKLASDIDNALYTDSKNKEVEDGNNKRSNS